MDPQELQERIAAFAQWGYRFEFEGGVSTPVLYRGVINRHEQRRRYFFDALLRVTGGSLSGRRVLDLGCNSGFWSLNAIEAGAEFVLGIDAEPTYIEQAELVFEAKAVERSRFSFERANLFEYDFAGRQFDVVLCLGLMEHISKPVELFEIIDRVGAEIVVIDTALSRSRSSCFEVSSLYDPRTAVEHELVLVPSRRALVELAGEFGFKVMPLAHEITDFVGMTDYRHERRLAFICSRHASLEGLPQAKAAAVLPWWASLLSPARAWERVRGRG